jgi:predicted glycogen debranching enzyme
MNTLQLEWIETDGLGGFSSSTVALANARCYHAVFAPAVHPPLGRMVLWAASEERLIVDGVEVALGARFGAGVAVFPRGFERLERFEARPWPRWVYAIDGAHLIREHFLVHGAGDAILGYTWSGPTAVELRVRPLLAFRDYHSVGRRDGATGSVERVREGVTAFRFRGDSPTLFVESAGSAFVESPNWIEEIALPIETERGLPDREDCWSPGEFVLRLEPGVTAWVRAGLDADAPGPPELLRESERARRRELEALAGPVPSGLEPLVLAADQFLVKRAGKNTVIAGYPWFTDWGRDTMISLPGLTIAAGRPEIARELILTFVEHMQDGLIPNRFPDAGETPEYNTVDATLWLAVAMRHTWEATRDAVFVREILPALRTARDRHLRGTRHGIHADADGLLSAGEEGYQLTWMDAKADDWVVTPRMGKPVEIQALWYNLLVIGGDLELVVGGDPGPWRAAAAPVPDAFRRTFWDPARGYLADVIAPDGVADWSLRPNQLFALSLPHPLADAEQARSILALVRAKLNTPRGLRSLDPAHPDYHPRYLGDRRTRDAAYHQGTVWGWLHGSYMEALLRYEGEAGRREARALLDGWAEHLGEACMGQASEVFEGDAPHTSRGCFAQAWTVAELLRIARLLGARGAA